ncbi:MAG TPA: hypothetical protein VNT50_12345 [Microbacterium sp.]|uniref:hypothetical protein n=1 Tax=Microbacterium sp. TaxID=51671 RepID=UPI002B5894FE|nr:hypothetical protein [Microbacterium sp.]HWI32271.1 hypothetical protein [Microbacterium sp.]
MTTDAGDRSSGARTVSLLRRIIVGIIVVAFGLAAIGGIAVLLGGDLGPDAGRVLGTTTIVGAFSVAVLCCAALAGRRLQIFGTIGAVVAIATAGLVIWAIWWQPGFSMPDVVWRLLWSGVTLTSAFALASLLLLLANRRRPAVRVGLAITLVLFGIVVALILGLVWFADLLDDDVYPRALGIFAILAALGAVVVPVLSLLMRDQGDGPTPDEISTEAAARLIAEAARRGITVDELVASLLDGAAPAAQTPAP